MREGAVAALQGAFRQEEYAIAVEVQAAGAESLGSPVGVGRVLRQVAEYAFHDADIALHALGVDIGGASGGEEAGEQDGG